MNQPKFVSLLLLFLIILFSSKAADINVKMPAALKVANKNLVLNGSGVRNKLCFDLYIGALYVQNKTSNSSQIVNADETMAIKIKVISDLITSKRLEEGIRSEISRVTGGKTAPYKEKIEQLVSTFKKNVNIGDEFDIVYIPGKGLNIYKNGSFQTAVEGLDFKQVVFSTWLGNDPADVNLKKGMMGA